MSEPRTYMPLFIGDYLVDTSDLSAEEHGAYLLLLMTMWRRGGSLPCDGERLRRIAAVPSRRWRAVWAAIGGFFTEQDGRITQKRLTRELEAARAKMAAAAEKAQHAARRRWSRLQAVDAPSNAPSNAPSMPQAMLEAMLEQCPSTSTSTSSSTSPVETIRFDSIRLDPAAGVVMSYWNDLTERCWSAESADGEYLRERLREGHSADTCCQVVEAAVAAGIQHPRQAFSRQRFGGLLATRRDPRGGPNWPAASTPPSNATRSERPTSRRPLRARSAGSRRRIAGRFPAIGGLSRPSPLVGLDPRLPVVGIGGDGQVLAQQRWPETAERVVRPEPVLQMHGRLLHKCHVLDIKGRS